MDGHIKNDGKKNSDRRRGLDGTYRPIDTADPVVHNLPVVIHKTKNSLCPEKSPHSKAFTLLEITLVLGMVVGLTAITIFGLGNSAAIARASRAEAAMRMIEAARLSYLSDHPEVPLANVSAVDLDQYIPGGTAAAVAILNDNGYTIRLPAHIRTPRIGYTLGNSSEPLKGFEQRP